MQTATGLRKAADAVAYTISATNNRIAGVRGRLTPGANFTSWTKGQQDYGLARHHVAEISVCPMAPPGRSAMLSSIQARIPLGPVAGRAERRKIA